MGMHRGSVTAFALGAAGVVAMPVAGIAAGHIGDALLSVPNSLSYLLVGVYATLRRPDNRAARRMLWWGALVAVAYGWGAVYSALAGSGGGSWPGILLLHVIVWLSAVASLGFLAVFPDGRYRSPSDRIAVIVLATLLPVAALGELFGVPVLTSTDFVWGDQVSATNPFAVPALAGAGVVAEWAMRLVPAFAFAVGAVLLLVRWVTSDATIRRRILWPLATAGGYVLLLAAVRTAVLLDPTMPDWLVYVLYLPVAFIVPVGLLIGILWYDLLDLGTVVRRSLLYVGLWVAIAGGYVLLAEVAGVVAAQRLPLAVAVATTVVIIAAAAAGRRRLTALADRIVFGRRLDGTALMVDVGRRLEAGGTAADIASTVAEAVRQGVRAEWVRVVIGAAQARTGAEPRGDDAPVLIAPLRADTGEIGEIGEIACGPREIGRYGERDRALLESLGRQAVLTASNATLSDALAAKVDDLEASRARILSAEEAGRRRLERDLHDGVQQDLVALLTRLALAASHLRRDPALGALTLDEARADARRALENVQELARGIHPTLLTDRGLVAAVEERAARMPVPVAVDSTGDARASRFHPDIEGAAYFTISECLANALKHADAAAIAVRIRLDDDELRIEVSDDGRGIDATAPRGTGLVGLRDRVEALGGAFALTSDTTGTRVAILLPAARESEKTDAGSR